MKKYITYISMTVVIALLGSWVIAGTITETGVNQGDLVRLLRKVVTLGNEVKGDFNSLRMQVLNRTLTPSGISGSTMSPFGTATTIRASNFTYTVNGVYYAGGNANILPFINTASCSATTQAAGYWAWYLFAIDKDGSSYLTKGSDATPSTSAVMPFYASNTAPYGAALVRATTSVFRMGSDRTTSTHSWTIYWYSLATVNSGASGSSAITADLLSMTQ